MKVGFIGTGNMGRHMASNLLKAGHELTVHDRRKEATEELIAQGASWAGTPKAVAQVSQVTITSLPGPPEVEEVALGANGILKGAEKGHLYIDASTSTPSLIRKIASMAATKGVDVLDAPVTGGVRGARKGTLTIMVGGNRTAFEFGKPILECLGERILLVGDIGAGYAAKLVNNMMALGNSLIAMEAMVVGAKAGVDVQKLFEVVDSGTGSSVVLKGMFPHMIFKGRFEPPAFTLSLATKDLRLAVDYARDLGVPLKIVESVSRALAEAVEQGLGEKDISTYVTLIEEAAGVELRIHDD